MLPNVKLSTNKPTIMGSGKSYEMHEIGETRAAGRAQAFDDILAKVKAAGGEIVRDEETPLYTDIGSQELEIGTERVVEFNLNRIDFQLIRQTKDARITGQGHQKSIEKLDVPHIDTRMRKKAETETEWRVVDLEELF